MRSRSGNPLVTLLMSLPLLAIPLMAVFGVPQFVPVIASSASSASDDARERPAARRSAGIGESLHPGSVAGAAKVSSREPLGDERLQDLFRPTMRTPRDAETARSSTPLSSSLLDVRTQPVATNLPARNSNAHAKLRDLFGDEASSPVIVPARFDESAAPSAAVEQSVQGLTWRQAVRRLNELGIQRFWLEPGQAGDFYFACEFAPDRDARILRRFEAEAPEPLQAVDLVLRQIDDWSPRR